MEIKRAIRHAKCVESAHEAVPHQGSARTYSDVFREHKRHGFNGIEFADADVCRYIKSMHTQVQGKCQRTKAP